MAEKKKRSIKIRMLIMVTSLILVVFTMIILFFKVFITQYIENNANDVLSESRQFISEMPVNGSRIDDNPMDKPKKSPSGDADALIISSDYKIVTPFSSPQALNENSSLYDFTMAVTEKKITLDSDEILKLQTDQGLYYYTSVPNLGSGGGFMVFFINMTNLYSFEQNLSNTLLLIMLVALIITIAMTYIISSRISEPVKELSEFAKRIGDGNYEVLSKDFKDLEVHDLKTSMNETSQKLMDYDNEQRVFFQNASHELRTPLQIIKSNAEGLEYNLIDKDKAATVIKKESDKLGELVEDIIILSRLEARSKDMVYTKGDLRETFSYTMERFAMVLKEKNIKVEYDFSEVPVNFEYDERSMERALQNLVSNAVRYTQGKIKITCKELEERIIIKVSDDGPGISKEDLPKIFDRFYKGKNGVHGIGLSIVKSIISSYKGRIEISTGIEGTTFTVFLPK